MYDYRTPAGREAAARFTDLLTAVRSRRLTRDQSRQLVRALGVFEQETGSELVLTSALNVQGPRR